MNYLQLAVIMLLITAMFGCSMGGQKENVATGHNDSAATQQNELVSFILPHSGETVTMQAIRVDWGMARNISGQKDLGQEKSVRYDAEYSFASGGTVTTTTISYSDSRIAYAFVFFNLSSSNSIKVATYNCTRGDCGFSLKLNATLENNRFCSYPEPDGGERTELCSVDSNVTVCFSNNTFVNTVVHRNVTSGTEELIFNESGTGCPFKT